MIKSYESKWEKHNGLIKEAGDFARYYTFPVKAVMCCRWFEGLWQSVSLCEKFESNKDILWKFVFQLRYFSFTQEPMQNNQSLVLYECGYLLACKGIPI